MIDLNSLLFQINDDYTVEEHYIGNLKSKIVTVDNFLRYPDDLRRFLEAIPTQRAIYEGQMPKGFYPGTQTYMTYHFGEIDEWLRHHMYQLFGYKPPYLNISWQTVDGNEKVYNQSNTPHTDHLTLAGNIFLNTPEEIDGETGTAFYRFKETGEEYADGKCLYRKERYGTINPDLSLSDFNPGKDSDRYECYHVSEAKFNRLNLYEGGLFHNIYIEEGAFRDNPRKTLSVIG